MLEQVQHIIVGILNCKIKCVTCESLRVGKLTSINNIDCYTYFKDMRTIILYIFFLNKYIFKRRVFKNTIFHKTCCHQKDTSVVYW